MTKDKTDKRLFSKELRVNEKGDKAMRFNKAKIAQSNLHKTESGPPFVIYCVYVRSENE